MKRLIPFLVVMGLLLAMLPVMSAPVSAVTAEKTYTLDADFDLGVLAGVEHETVPDQLQLSIEQTTLPFIWVANSGESTVSKIDTVTGVELGRYRTGPGYEDPSRTTVDLNGDLWVGNRQSNTAVKIALYPADVDNDGTIETSTGPSDVKPFGEDEAVLVRIPVDSGPRAVAVDASNNVWIGGYGYNMGYYDGQTGAKLKNIYVGRPCYGALIDGDGTLWISNDGSGSLTRIDNPSGAHTMTFISAPGGWVYGLGIDSAGYIYTSSYTNNMLRKLDPSTNTWVYNYSHGQLYGGRGVCVGLDGDVWVADSLVNTVSRHNASDGVIKAVIPVGNTPTGVAVDAAGKIWVTNYGSSSVMRIDPATNLVDFTQTGHTNPYNYSDMTGIIARNITSKVGTWTVVFDSEESATEWGNISWNDSTPEGTSITVKARSSEDSSDPSAWSDWEDISNDVDMTLTPDGRFLQIETTLKILSGEISPVLNDLTVKVANQPPVAEANGPYAVNEGECVELQSIGSFDPDLDSLIYEWDLNNDGVFETIDATPDFCGVDGPAEVTVTLKVSDPHGLFTTDSSTVTVNNVTPAVGPITAPTDPVQVNTAISVTAPFTDPGINDTHIATWTWGDGNSSAGTVSETNGSGSVVDNHTYASPGVYTISLIVTDKDGGTGSCSYEFIVVYDPSAGFVTGGGYIDSPAGSYIPDPSLTGRANFGFVSRYQKGATVPTGNTQFQFQTAGMNFHSSTYEWLVVNKANSCAQYKGSGTVNGEGSYKFMLWAVDKAPDTFRIKIWTEIQSVETVLYDTGFSLPISGGNIVVHTK